MTLGSLEAILAKLGVDRPETDLPGLRQVYAAWCSKVPFDNVLKLVHLAEDRSGPLPGSTSEDFFASWLEHGTGGTCWSGNSALHDLVAALGFDVARAVATMMPTPDAPGPNHGSVVVTLGGDRWIADASILSGVPLRILEEGEAPEREVLPRVEWRNGRTTVIWRTLVAPDGFPCRFERIGVDPGEWDALHQQTAGWGPFNFAANTRVLRGTTAVGYALGQQFALDPDGVVSVEALDRTGRDRFLVEELGISEELVARVPDDRPLPPRPAS